MRKKLLAVTLGTCCIMGTMLSGCGAKEESQTGTVTETAKEQAENGGSGSGETKTVVFWDENAGPNRTPYYEELIRQFEEQNPDIKIEYVGLPSSDAKNKIEVAVTGNAAPDVCGMPPQWQSGFILNKALAPLDKYFTAWDEHGEINGSIIESLRSLSVDGKLYCIPNTSTFNPMFWGRKDWFEEKGVKAPETWDDFYALVEQFTDSAAGTYGFSIRGGAGGPMQLQEYLYAYSGITQPFTEDGKSTLNDPKNIEAMDRLKSIYNKYTPESDISNGYKEMVAAFDTGSAAMIQHNLGSYGEHKKTLGEDKYFAFAPPASATGKRIISGGYPVNGYVLFEQSKVKDEAWKFISFLCSAKSQSYWNQNIGQVPTNINLADEDWVKSTQHINEAMKIQSDPNAIAFPYPLYLPDYQSIQDSIAAPGFQAVLAGQKTSEEFLTEWAAAMSDAEAEYQQLVK